MLNLVNDIKKLENMSYSDTRTSTQS